MWAFSEGIENKSLRVILEEHEPTSLPIRAVYRRNRFQPAKVKCFIDFLSDEFKLGLF
jgi:DNA-binding transcriptional LysR family regulator